MTDPQLRLAAWFAALATAMLLAGACCMALPRQTALTITKDRVAPAQPAAAEAAEDWIDDQACTAEQCCAH